MADDDEVWHPGIKDAGGVSGWLWRFSQFGMRGALRLGPEKVRPLSVRRSVHETALALVEIFGVEKAIALTGSAALDAQFRKFRKEALFFWAMQQYMNDRVSRPERTVAVTEDGGKWHPSRRARWALESAVGSAYGVEGDAMVAPVTRDWPDWREGRRL